MSNIFTGDWGDSYFMGVSVFEAIMSFWMDQWKFSRNKAVAINAILIPLLSLSCALGFNVWSGAELPGIGNIQAIEDFVVSNNLLIVGSLVFTLFCVSKRGWGWKSFLQEVNTGCTSPKRSITG